MPSRRIVVLAAFVAALALGGGPVAFGQSEGDTLSVDMTVDEATDELEAAEQAVEDLRLHLAMLRIDRGEYVRRLEQRSSRLDQAARDLREARTSAQQLAVQAYIGAGSSPSPETVAFANGDLLTYTFQTTLVEASTNARYRAADYYRQLREQADDAVHSTVAHLDALDESVALAELTLGLAQDAERTAAVVLAEARAAERAARQAAAIGGGGGGGGTPPPGGFVPLGQWPGGPSYAQWAALRNCESGGNYQAVSPSGLYRGAFQFDYGTWASVGGSGDPAAAPPAEQDHRAQILWSERGASPWPICGQYLQ